MYGVHPDFRCNQVSLPMNSLRLLRINCCIDTFHPVYARLQKRALATKPIRETSCGNFSPFLRARFTHVLDQHLALAGIPLSAGRSTDAMSFVAPPKRVHERTDRRFRKGRENLLKILQPRIPSPPILELRPWSGQIRLPFAALLTRWRYQTIRIAPFADGAVSPSVIRKQVRDGDHHSTKRSTFRSANSKWSSGSPLEDVLRNSLAVRCAQEYSVSTQANS